MTTNRLATLTSLLFATGMVCSATAAAATRAESCDQYANEAASQNFMNQHIKCNYSGPRWSNDTAGQKQWCMGVRPQITAAETAAREKLLNACYENKVARNNILPPLVPGACRYNPQGYKPVAFYLTRQNYNQDPEPTVLVHSSSDRVYGDLDFRSGLIDKDYNGDGKSDYLFMERSPEHKFRSVLCMSSPSGWKRTQLYTHEEDLYPHFGVKLEHIGDTANGFYFSSGTSEHNYGSDSSRWTYSYSKQHGGFLLDTYESSSYSGDGQRPTTRSVTDYVKGERRETVDCSGMAEWAREGCTQKDNVVTRMKPAEYTAAKRLLGR